MADATTRNMKRTPAQIGLNLDNRVVMIKSGEYIYFRTKWTDDYDLIQKVSLVSTVANDNNPINPTYAGTVPVATLDSAVPTTSYTTTYQATTDDACPVYINGNYIGGNHGTTWCVQITVTGHDKTAVDVGSIWQDSTPREFTLMRVVDANTLIVMAENTGTGGVWDFVKSFAGSQLAHVSGATHTATMTFSSPTTAQLEPSIKNQTRKIYLNNTEITTDGVYFGDHFDVVNTYDINDAPDMVVYAQANVGHVNYTDPAIDSVARVTITYRYSENGSCTVYQNFQALKDLELGYIGFVQAYPLTIPDGGSLNQYVNKTADFVIGGTTYTLKTIHDITANAQDLELTAARWVSASDPPDRYVQFTKTSGDVKDYGFAVGYNTKIGLGVPATRVTNCSTAGMIGGNDKQYPKIATGDSTTWSDSMVDAGTIFDGVAFRCPINYTKHPNATNVSWYYVGDDCYLNLDYHSAQSEYVGLPNNLVGKRVEVVESDGLVVDSNYVTHDGLHITVAGTYGMAVIRLYNDDSSSAATSIQNTLVNAKGDIITASAADTPARLAVGSKGQVLMPNSSEATGLIWQDTSAFDTWRADMGSRIITGSLTVKGWTYPCSYGGGYYVPTANSQLCLEKIWVPYDISVTGIVCFKGDQALANANNENAMALYTSAGALIGKTADIATSLNGTPGLVYYSLAGGPYSITGGPGVYVYGAILQNNSTGNLGKLFSRYSASGLMGNAGQSDKTSTHGYINSTTSIPANLGTITIGSYPFWLALY